MAQIFTILQFFLYLIYLLLLILTLFFFRDNLLQLPVQLILIDWLEQIIFHAIFQRFLRIVKVFISTDNYKMAFHALLGCLLDHFQSCQHRHPDIRDHDIRRFGQDLLIRCLPVCHKSNTGQSQPVPLYQSFHKLSHFYLIICN